jgi:hypothetical protein
MAATDESRTGRCPGRARRGLAGQGPRAVQDHQIDPPANRPLQPGGEVEAHSFERGRRSDLVEHADVDVARSPGLPASHVAEQIDRDDALRGGAEPLAEPGTRDAAGREVRLGALDRAQVAAALGAVLADDEVVSGLAPVAAYLAAAPAPDDRAGPRRVQLAELV